MPNDVGTNGIGGAQGDETIAHAVDSEGNPTEASIVRQLGELARELRAEPDMARLMNHIVAATVAEIDGAAYGGITMLESGKTHAVAATDPIVEQLDETQNQLGDGPCISSLREQMTVRSDDFDREPRWPKFTASAVTYGVRSMLSVQLFVEGDNLGALNLYATEPDAFTVDDEAVAIAMAAHAAVAMAASRQESNLTTALRSRDLIGQGKGILMERYKIDADEAFELIVLTSQRTNRKVRDVAQYLADTGVLRTQ